MPRITTFAAVLAAGAVVAPAASAAAPFTAPGDRGDRYVLPSHRVPENAFGEGYARDLLWRGSVPGPPTWPVDPEPLPRPAEPGLVTHGDGNWMLAGAGIAGAGIAAGGVVGLARRYRIRARRLAL
jgi:hypothetical protein